MLVRTTKSSLQKAWYADKLGQTFEVQPELRKCDGYEEPYYVLKLNPSLLIDEGDCEVIDEELSVLTESIKNLI